MSRFLAVTTLACVAATTVSGRTIGARTTVPPTYDQGYLEPYATYHARYLALDCQDKHDTLFFESCCHPLLATQSLSDRPEECNPYPSSTSTSATSTLETTSDSEVYTDGYATYFYQNGVAGACGTVHSDYDMIAAIDQDRYGNSGAVSALCGQKVKITNPANGNTVTVTIADDCPTCRNSDSIDLSVGAFEQIADLSEGIVSIDWEFVN
ncbi:barwin-like endoglucanase [Wolfiporia cocos MD-104 SS10]|uniref:Barwin-like endoglucanase n=1 Tax=Wolfiporia cocos (strain MD-104) TaxID=742152 RepID=A0A2H3J8P9_WOLCO|nr:barwin-like endoglucanase [Wolfiporia cocos MD-104 SS10]